MAQWLRQSTATTVLVGPLVDSATAVFQSGLTITSGEVLVWKEGGTSLNAKNESSAAVHRGFGHYTVALDTTDTNTAGQFTVAVYEAGIMVATKSFMVAKTEPWDALFSTSSSDRMPSDLKKINGTASYAANLAASASVIQRATIFDDGGTYTNSTTVLYSDDITEATDDHHIGNIIKFTSGALFGQSARISDYALTAGLYGTFTLEDALTEAPANDTTFIIV